MGTESLTIEIDTELMARLRAAGVDPKAYAERVFRSKLAQQESADQRASRAETWRAEHRDELESYDAFVREHGLWSDGLRLF